ncbi:helix-turn-helix domain-containing protein [Streptomyces flaveolus]
METVGMFAEGQDNAVMAKELRVSVRSVQRWRRSWQEGGRQTLYSKGSAAVPG